ncbi:MAG TPA: hypothetical protein VK327_09235 [Candidatus Paceibacterota bacterium]|nr:hypothetical protein [Candidatus Paceibacterota bacterium]
MKLLQPKTLKLLCLAALLAAISPARLLACAVCYGESDAPMARGVTWGILALAGIIGCVLSGVVVFFVHVKRKSSALEELNSQAESEQRNS